MDTPLDPTHYTPVLAAVLAAQPDPPAITGLGLVQARRLVGGVGDLAGDGRGIAAYRVAQFPLRPGLELVVVYAPNAAGSRPDPQDHMRVIEGCMDRLRAVERVQGIGGWSLPPT